MGYVVSPSSSWHTSVDPLPPKADLKQLSASELASLTSRASDLLANDAKTYSSSSAKQSASDAHFLKTILSTGTLSDRLSALTLLVQASPVHNTAALESLKSMAQKGRAKGGREEGLKAVRCVVDWWVGGGGSGRKLKYFRDQPLLHPDATDAHLLVWYFEDWLKKYFFSMLQILETFSLDPLPYVRNQTLSFLATLLRAQPEQEQNLLRLLVNKLGDTEKAVCSRASYHVLQVLQAHPAMKGVIVREVRALVFRLPASTAAQAAPDAPTKSSHIRFSDSAPSSSKTKPKATEKEKDARWNSHAWYYASVTLNQVVLTPSMADRAVARTLVDMYFEMFEEILGSKREDDEGHYSDNEESGLKGKDAKTKSKGKGKDAPYQTDKKGKKAKEITGAAGFSEVEDSSSRLIGAILTGVNRALPFAQMHLSSDSSAVFQKHIDTLFRITHTSTFNISLQALSLILQISASLSPPSSGESKPSTSAQTSASTFSTTLRDRFYRTLYASLTDPRLGTSNKQALYLNLVFKALKADHNTARVAAFVRRFVQVLASGAGAGGAIEFVAGGLYLLGELFSTTPGLKQLLGSSKSKAAPPPNAATYDPRKRDPQYADAFSTPMYEILPLLHHYHPTVSLHARQLFSSTPITSTPDLSLNTLSHFLDRFVYKNPKKPKPKGSSAMQPSLESATMAGGVTLLKGEVPGASASSAGVPVNDERFWRRKAEDVPVDEAFFRTYFVRKEERDRQKAAKVAKRKGRGGGSDEEGDGMSDADSGVDNDDDGGDVEAEGEEEEEEEEEEEGGSESEDGGFDLSSKGQKAVPEEDDEEDSDAEEAEIWKVMQATMPSEFQDDDLTEDSDDSDDVPSGLDDLSDEEDEVVDAGGSDEDEDEKNEEEEGDGDDFSLAEGSDAEDLIPLDDEVPMGLIDYDGSDASSDEESADEGGEEWGGISTGPQQNSKRKRDDEREGKKAQRKKLRALPTFASYEDYAKMIEDAPEDNI